MKMIAKTLRAVLPVALSLTATLGLAEDILYGQGIFWRIDYGAVAPSYLLGTMHTADQRVLDLPNGGREAFEASDKVWPSNSCLPGPTRNTEPRWRCWRGSF